MSDKNRYIDLYLTLDDSNTLQAVKDFETYEVISIENLKIYAGNYIRLHLAAEANENESEFINFHYLLYQEDELIETSQFETVVNSVFNSSVYNTFFEQEMKDFHLLSPGKFNFSIHKFIGDIGEIEEPVVVGVSNPIAITVLPSSSSSKATTIKNNSTTDTYNELLSELIGKLNGGKLIEDLGFGSDEGYDKEIKADDDFTLYVKYINEKDWKKVGRAYPNLEDLGLILGRNGTLYGGGRVGDGTRLYGDRSGFAGGYSAKARTGGAVGDKAAAYKGFAGGDYARNINATDGISIGKDSYVYRSILDPKINESYDEKNPKFENGSISIGTSAKVYETTVEQRSNMAIGDHAQVSQSNRSISIGAANMGKITTPLYVKDNNRQNLRYSAFTKVAESSNAIAIGPEAYVRLSHYSIGIGLNAMAYGTKTGQPVYTINGGKYSHTIEKNYETSGSIAIGADSLCRAKCSIALGYEAEAGVADNGMAIYGNYLEDTKQDVANPAGIVSAISIGYRAKARRNSSVAIGKQAEATQYGCIAIGKLSKAGGKYYHRTRTEEESKGTPRAIAIGVGAEALKKDAVQIGQGTNNTENSFQFKNVVIVKDGCVQNDLTKGQKGSLPIEHGGTGAETRNQARKNLGIFAGEKLLNFNTSNENLDGNNGRGISLKIPFNTKFKTKVPTVVASLAFEAGEADSKNPKFHSLIITEITKEYFVVKYNYTGGLKKNEVEALKPKVNYILIYT